MSRDRGAAPLISFEHRMPDAEVLMVTNLWPHRDNDRYGIFVYRQVQSLLALGLKCDVFFVHGYRAKRAYFPRAPSSHGCPRGEHPHIGSCTRMAGRWSRSRAATFAPR